jgi:hypothetical protein
MKIYTMHIMGLHDVNRTAKPLAESETERNQMFKQKCHTTYHVEDPTTSIISTKPLFTYIMYTSGNHFHISRR